MPNRILREGILTSEGVDALSQGAEIFLRRLMSVVDDYGRYFAHPTLLRSSCWPLSPDKVTEKEILRWLSECTSGDRPLVRIYEAGGKRYLELTGFGQRVRSPSKFPGPDHGQVARSTLEELSRRGSHNSGIVTADPPSSRCSRAEPHAWAESKAESESEGESDAKATHAPPANGVQSAPADWAERMYSRHPKKSGKPLVEQECCRLWGRMQEPATQSAEIEGIHALWCNTDDWRKENGRYAPKLAEWLADEGYTRKPDLIDPIRTNGRKSRLEEMIDIA